MNKIVFFAQIRELIGENSIELNAKGMTVEQLIEQLSLTNDKWSLALKEHTVLCAINKSLVDHQYLIQPNDEIAFFPPVTGG